MARKRDCCSLRTTIQDIGGDKSFVDDLNTERGIVSSRVALLLRSAEIKPLFSRFVLWNISPWDLKHEGGRVKQLGFIHSAGRTKHKGISNRIRVWKQIHM